MTAAETQPPSGASTPHTNLYQVVDNRHLSVTGPRPIPSPNLDTPEVGERSGEFEGEEDEEDEEEELTPEELIPQYIKLQTQIYSLDPASTTVVGGKKGKGRKLAKPPIALSPEKMKELKKLKDKLRALIQDPLLDIKESEFIWAEERIRLEKESWTKKQPEGKWTEGGPKLPRAQSPPPHYKTTNDEENNDKGMTLFPSESEITRPVLEDDSNLDFIGGLFEPPPTEETTVGQIEQEKVNIRDFEETSSTGNNFGKNKPKWKAGVDLAKVKDVLGEICKSR